MPSDMLSVVSCRVSFGRSLLKVELDSGALRSKDKAAHARRAKEKARLKD